MLNRLVVPYLISNVKITGIKKSFVQLLKWTTSFQYKVVRLKKRVVSVSIFFRNEKNTFYACFWIEKS